MGAAGVAARGVAGVAPGAGAGAGDVGVDGTAVPALAAVRDVCFGGRSLVWGEADAHAAAAKTAISRRARRSVRCAWRSKGTWWESNPHTGAEDPLGANPARSHVATPASAPGAPAPVRGAGLAYTRP